MPLKEYMHKLHLGRSSSPYIFSFGSSRREAHPSAAGDGVAQVEPPASTASGERRWTVDRKVEGWREWKGLLWLVHEKHNVIGVFMGLPGKMRMTICSHMVPFFDRLVFFFEGSMSRLFGFDFKGETVHRGGFFTTEEDKRKVELLVTKLVALDQNMLHGVFFKIFKAIRLYYMTAGKNFRQNPLLYRGEYPPLTLKINKTLFISTMYHFG